jgi:hypothetical protein
VPKRRKRSNSHVQQSNARGSEESADAGAATSDPAVGDIVTSLLGTLQITALYAGVIAMPPAYRDALSPIFDVLSLRFLATLFDDAIVALAVMLAVAAALLAALAFVLLKDDAGFYRNVLRYQHRRDRVDGVEGSISEAALYLLLRRVDPDFVREDPFHDRIELQLMSAVDRAAVQLFMSASTLPEMVMELESDTMGDKRSSSPPQRDAGYPASQRGQQRDHPTVNAGVVSQPCYIPRQPSAAAYRDGRHRTYGHGSEAAAAGVSAAQVGSHAAKHVLHCRRHPAAACGWRHPRRPGGQCRRLDAVTSDHNTSASIAPPRYDPVTDGRGSTATDRYSIPSKNCGTDETVGNASGGDVAACDAQGMRNDAARVGPAAGSSLHGEPGRRGARAAVGAADYSARALSDAIRGNSRR